MSQKFRVRILSWSPLGDSPALQDLRDKGVEVVITQTSPGTTEDELIELMRDFDAAIPGVEPFTRKVIESLPRLKIIARSGVGFNSIDVQAAEDNGVVVAITPGANRHAVADHTWGFMIMLAHLIPQNQQVVAEKRWIRLPGRDVYGKTLGIIGVGNIGKEVARRARGFDMEVLGYDIVQDESFARTNELRYTSLEEIMSRADFITLHVPYYKLTRHMVSHKELALVKPTAYLINTARGGILDEDALYRALVEKRLAGAALDVMEDEPNFGSPLMQLENVIWTPHVAGITEESRQACVAGACRNVWNALTGEGPIVSAVHPGDVS
jgi:D-3-phosphoglycerate dehydrogenase